MLVSKIDWYETAYKIDCRIRLSFRKLFQQFLTVEKPDFVEGHQKVAHLSYNGGVAYFIINKPLVINESIQSVPLRILLLFEFKLHHCCLEIFLEVANRG